MLTTQDIKHREENSIIFPESCVVSRSLIVLTPETIFLNLRGM